MNGYICIYRNKQCEVHAETTYEAQTKAAAIFKAKKQYEVSVYLAEENGEQVVHSTAEV